MDTIDGIIVGAAAAAIGTVLAFKFLNRVPEGGEQPNQINVGYPAAVGGRVLDVQVPTKLDRHAAPVAQNTPITEAAYNMYPVTFAPGFGPGTNQPAEEAVLPI